MKTVNLLPYWYEKQQRQNRRFRTHVIAMVALGLGMIAVGGLAHRYIDHLQHDLAGVSAELSRTVNPRTEVAIQRAQLAALDDRQSACREVGNTIPMSAVIQQVQNDMTAGMALSRFAIDVRPEPIKGSGIIGDPKHPIKNHNVAHITAVGIAPNDVAIAQLIGKISSNHLFGDVALNYTRSELLNEHSIRRFEIQMVMDLDRLTTADPDATPTRQTAMIAEQLHAG